MEWLTKLPSVGDDVVVLCWQRQHEADTRVFSLLQDQAFRDFGQPVLILSRINYIDRHYTYINREGMEHTSLKSNTLYTARIEAGDGALLPYNGRQLSFTYDTDHLQYTLNKIKERVPMALRQFAINHMYPVVVSDNSYNKVINDLRRACGVEVVDERPINTLQSVMEMADRYGVRCIDCRAYTDKVTDIAVTAQDMPHIMKKIVDMRVEIEQALNQPAPGEVIHWPPLQPGDARYEMAFLGGRQGVVHHEEADEPPEDIIVEQEADVDPYPPAEF